MWANNKGFKIEDFIKPTTAAQVAENELHGHERVGKYNARITHVDIHGVDPRIDITTPDFETEAEARTYALNIARNTPGANRITISRICRESGSRRLYEDLIDQVDITAEAAAKEVAQPAPRTKAERRANRRQLQATLRQRRRDNQATHRATKAVATGQPQSAKNHLIAAGLTPTDAKRYAGAFSRGMVADDTAETKIKLKARVRKTVTIKLYSAATFALRLATYRPRDKAAAARFEQAALRLAA